ncbi:hypothetical protein BJX99DRAFT_233085 [Aspergillus californicus]
MSGLSMELADGFVKSSHPPAAIGYFPETFNYKDDIDLIERERRRWQVAASLALPGIGIAYTPPGLDRSDYEYLKDVPNSLSTEKDVSDPLLIPQAMFPVSGTAWGLRLSYNCSIVRSVSELKVKKGSLFVQSINGTVEFTDHGRSRRLVTAFNTTVENLFAYVEVGGFVNTAYTDPSADPEPDILEYVMWQVRLGTSYPEINLKNGFSHKKIDSPITDAGSPLVRHANGSFTPNSTFLDLPPGAFSPDSMYDLVSAATTPNATLVFTELAEPVGVSCRARSETGTAKINPGDLTFSEFVRVPPADPGEDGPSPARPFGWAPNIYLRYPDTAFESLFESTKQPISNPWGASRLYTGFFSATRIKESLMQAYAQDALQLMYYGLDTFNMLGVALNLIASRPGKVLGPGSVPPHISSVMLGIWAAGCVFLGLCYGFRRRRAEMLDGYIVMQLGVEYASRVRDAPGVLGSQGQFSKRKSLWRLPGGFGDPMSKYNAAHTSLVEPQSSRIETTAQAKPTHEP